MNGITSTLSKLSISDKILAVTSSDSTCANLTRDVNNQVPKDSNHPHVVADTALHTNTYVVFVEAAAADEIAGGDQPIDFSQKYGETQQVVMLADDDTDDKCKTATIAGELSQHGAETGAAVAGTYDNVVTSYNSTFSMYAETDLDQPTDYSLRYAEDDYYSDSSDVCDKIAAADEGKNGEVWVNKLV